MRIVITTEPQETTDAQEALGMLLHHTKTVTASFATVAEPYKPIRLRRAFCEVSNTYAELGRRALSTVLGIDDVKLETSKDGIMPRAEWTHTALLIPAPDAPALDGCTIALFASAHLIVWYGIGRCAAMLYSSDHDVAARAEIAASGWQFIEKPSAWRRVQTRINLPPWRGAVSLRPVPLQAKQLLPPSDSDGVAGGDPPRAATGPTTRLEEPAPDDAKLTRWLRGVLGLPEQPSQEDIPEIAGDTSDPINPVRADSPEELAEEQSHEYVVTSYDNGIVKAAD